MSEDLFTKEGIEVKPGQIWRDLDRPRHLAPVLQNRGGRMSEIAIRSCKHGEVGCGQFYDCGLCARERRATAYRHMTPEQKAYDGHVDPAGAYHTDFPQGCSCHINAPCWYCTSREEAE